MVAVSHDGVHASAHMHSIVVRNLFFVLSIFGRKHEEVWDRAPNVLST